jgi:hypothetical protein
MFSQPVISFLLDDTPDDTLRDRQVSSPDGTLDDFFQDPTIPHVQLLAGVQTIRAAVSSRCRVTSRSMDRSEH